MYRTVFFALMVLLLTASQLKQSAELETAKRIITLQDSLIKNACEHSADRHDCDCPWMDTDITILINELKSKP